MELDILPVIDWDLGAKLVGNKRDAAIEMMHMLCSTLPAEMITIQELFNEKNYAELLKRVHKLHGAVSYCGTPRLKSVLTDLESQLKNNTLFSLPELIEQLRTEIKLVLEHPAVHS